MPYYVFSEIWTPLAWFGIHLLRELESGALYIKIGRGRRRRLIRGRRR